MTTNTHFENKEHYLAFRAVWAKAVNDKDTHLEAEHFLMYNILRNKEPSRGFTPITNLNKIMNGMYMNFGLYYAAWRLGRLVKNAKEELDGKLSDYSKPDLDAFINPFEGELTYEMLANIEVPKVSPIEGNYGKGRKIAEKVRAGEASYVTYTDLQNLYEEVA